MDFKYRICTGHKCKIKITRERAHFFFIFLLLNYFIYYNNKLESKYFFFQYNHILILGVRVPNEFK